MRRARASILLAVATVLGAGLAACSQSVEGYVLEDYELATGSFTYDVSSTVEVVYDLSSVARDLPGAEGLEQLADAGPTQSKSAVEGTAEVEIEADGADRSVTVTFAEAGGELSGALGTSEIKAEDLPTQEFTFTPAGEVTSGKGGTTAGLPGLDLGRAFNCPPLPEGGAADGETWEAEVELPVAGGGTASAASSNSFEQKEVEGRDTGTVTGRLKGPVSLRIDAGLLTEQLQIPNAPAPPEGLQLDVTADLDLTVTCDLGIPDKTLLGRSITGSMSLTFGLPPEVTDPAQAGLALIFDGLRIDNTENTEWTAAG